MNEELKIIIKAVTDEAKKEIAEVKKELSGVKEESQTAGKTVDAALRGFAKGAAIAVTAITALTAAMTKLGKSAQEINKGFSKMKSSFEASGASAKQATKYYKELFGILGDHDRTVETGQSLARVTTDPAALGDYKNIVAGAVSQYGEGYNSEALAENIAETVAAAKVTGDLERVLVEAGISIDGFNAALQQATTTEQREILIRSTLNGVLGNAGKAYIAANQATIAYNQSQANLNIALASAAAYTTPLLTSLNNLSTSLLNVLSPALETVSLYLTAFIQLITEAIQWVGNFFGLFSAKTEQSTADMAGYRAAMQDYLNSLRRAFGGANEELDDSKDKINEVKKATMGFDELNIVSKPVSVSTDTVEDGGGSLIGSLPVAPNPEDFGIGGTIDTSGYQKSLEEAKENLKAIGSLVAIIGGGLLLWKIADFLSEIAAAKTILRNCGDNAKYFYQQLMNEKAQAYLDGITSKLKFIGGIFLIVAGAIALVAGFTDAWVNGVDWGNFAAVLGGIALIVGGLALTVSPAAAAIGIVVGGIAMLVLGVKDLITNGYSLVSAIMAIVGAAAIAFSAANPIVGVITLIVGGIYILWNECDAFKNFILAVWEEIVNGAKAFLKTLEPLWESIKGAFEAIVEFIVTLWEVVLVPAFKAAWNAIKAVWNAVKPFFEAIWAVIKLIFSPVTAVLGGYFTGAWEAIKLVWNTVIGYFTAIFDTIKHVFKTFTAILKGDWDGAWAHIKAIVSTWKNFFQGVWDGIKKVFSTVGSFFKNTFEGAWNGVKKVFTTGGKVFEGIKEGIASVFTVIVNGIIKGINLIIAAPFKTINGILNKIRAIEFLNISPFKKLWKKDLLPVPEIPLLATGGIVNSATMAVIGERGREAVLPLENNTGWMDMLAQKIVAMQGGTTPSKLVLMVDGKELGYATINSINDITRQTGTLQLNVI